MGVFSQNPLVSTDQEKKILRGSLWGKVWLAQTEKSWSQKNQIAAKKSIERNIQRRRSASRIAMTRQQRLMRNRRGTNYINRKVRTLKQLIPNSEARELDGLFRETADYIFTLQCRVRAMQLMVNVLTGSYE